MMKPKYIFALVLGSFLILGLAGSGQAAGSSGQVKVGYVVVDEEGSQAVYQPTYNLYEGVSLSLENFSHRFDNGTRLMANLENVTLNNRRLMVGVSSPRQYGLTLKNNQYRRTYGDGGGEFTRRRTSSGELWYQPHQYVRLSGGYGQTARHGQSVNLFDSFGSRTTNVLDYTQTYIHAGLRLKKGRRQIDLGYRSSDFSDEVSGASDRTSKRLRVTFATPVVNGDKLALSGGFQQFSYELTDRVDTLTTNTGWAGLRFLAGRGYSLRYSFVFNRARRTGDISATDNISNAFFASKVWPRQAGLTVGFRKQLKDDVWDEISTSGIVVSGWCHPAERFTIKTGYGSESKTVDAGRTLTGDADYTRFNASVKYDLAERSRLRVKYSKKNTENDQIGSTAEFTRLGSDLTYWLEAKGNIQLSVSHFEGKYENSDGLFDIDDYVLAGDLTTAEISNWSGGLGGTYYRSRGDLDVESFSIRFSGSYKFGHGHRLGFKYTVHNFDNLAFIAPVYTEYYTANVLELFLVKEL